MLWAVLKGFYPYFAVLAVIGIVLRIRRKQWTRAETLLLVLWLGHAALLVLQIVLMKGEFSRRYLLPAAPLAFGWAACALTGLLRRFPPLRLLIPCIALVLLYDAYRPFLERCWKRSKKTEYEVVRHFAPVIRNDWKGERRFRPEPDAASYHAPFSPGVEGGRFPYIGYAAGGRAVLRDGDYKIFEGTSAADPYEEISRVETEGRTFILGRRRTSAHESSR